MTQEQFEALIPEGQKVIMIVVDDKSFAVQKARMSTLEAIGLLDIVKDSLKEQVILP